MHRISNLLFFGFVLFLCFQSSTAITSKINNLDWVYYPEWLNSQNVLLLTAEAHVWRSTDEGFSWTDITGNLPGATEPNSQPAFIYKHRFNASMVYIRGNSMRSWISYDFGMTWRGIIQDRAYRNIEFHRKRADLILAGANINFPVYPGTLHLSRDFGVTWITISGNVTQYGWGDAGVGDVSDDRIYAIRVNASGERNLEYTDDFGGSWTTDQYQAYQFIFREKMAFAVVYLPIADEVVIKVSNYIGSPDKLWREAQFPFGDDLAASGYSILEDTDAVFMGVNHGSSVWGNIYSSDSTGGRYTMAIEHAGQQYPTYDFMRVAGLDGIYLANTVSNWRDDIWRQSDALKISMYTFDNGAFWNQLTPPKTDNQGNPFACTGICRLNLHGWSSFDDRFGPFYAVHTALGIVIANGNVGQYLSYDPDATYVMVSRDAGLSWNAIYQGPAIYEIGDHGGLIVLADTNNPTTTLYWTTSEGTQLPMSSYQFSPVAVHIHNVIIEPSWKGRRFIVMGWHLNGTSTLIGVDFADVWPRNCSTDPASPDYENWSPRSHLSGSDVCVMGRNMTYRRRVASAQCFNPERFDRLVSWINCTCTKEDYECDFDYYRNRNGECEAVPNYTPTIPPNPCYGKYWISRGYQKEPGNTCSNQLPEYEPLGPFPCPDSGDDTGSSSGGKGWVAFVVTIPIAIILLVIGFFALRSEWVQNKLPIVKAFANSKAGYLFLRNKGEDNRLVDDDEQGGLGTLEEEPSPHSLDDDETLHSHTPAVVPSSSINATKEDTTPNLISIDDKPGLSSFDEFDPRK